MSDNEPGHLLTADEIWAADDIEEKTVDVPEWGGQVKIRGLTLAQIASIAQKSMRRNPQTGADEINREVSMCLTLAEGMVSPKISTQDARRLRDKGAGPVSRIVQAINALGATQEAVDEADKSLWPEPPAQVPILAGSGIGHDARPSDNGNVHG